MSGTEMETSALVEPGVQIEHAVGEDGRNFYYEKPGYNPGVDALEQAQKRVTDGRDDVRSAVSAVERA